MKTKTKLLRLRGCCVAAWLLKSYQFPQGKGDVRPKEHTSDQGKSTKMHRRKKARMSGREKAPIKGLGFSYRVGLFG